ncbi:uncharacterized protein VTP21DRAFT_929 [Calcarisporiella thermophila]|uniref:uncharacterized protein n=1 Tax=Calcarisporiella thermophila TaxID=911321 RepID=UPI003743917D
MKSTATLIAFMLLYFATSSQAKEHEAIRPIVGRLKRHSCEITPQSVTRVLAVADAVVCIEENEPVPPAVAAAALKGSPNCDSIKKRVRAAIAETGQLKERAIACEPDIVVYVTPLKKSQSR